MLILKSGVKFVAHLTALLLLVVLTWRVYSNLRFLKRTVQNTSRDGEYPRVSVLVPVRNESDNIRRCIESLANQGYPALEIIVLDDASTDDTLQQLHQLALRYANLRIIEGSSGPPPSWNGKSYACQRLSEQANGEWLLFTDADTIHFSESVSKGIQQALRLKVDLLSAIPYQQTESWSERLMVSFIMDFLPVMGIDFRQLPTNTGQRVIANGQYILVRADVYRELGGHCAIHSALIDDFALADLFAQHGHGTAIVNGASMVACRMYRNAAEVWSGFSKNMMLALQTYSGQRRSLGAALLFGWGYAALFFFPYYNLIAGSGSLLALLEITWLVGLRLAVGRTFHRPVIESLWVLPSAVGVMLLGLYSLCLRFQKRHILWKGRAYTLR